MAHKKNKMAKKFTEEEMKNAKMAKEQEEKEALLGEFNSPKELLSELTVFGGHKQGLIDKNKFVFRGQGDSRWTLISKLGRQAKSLSFAGENNPKYTVGQLEGVYTEHFIRNAKLFKTDLPPEDDKVAWLTLMQHHGAPTRLLDWTWSPFVALFMTLAFEAQNDTKESSLYILNYRALSLYWGTELWDNRGSSIWGSPPQIKPEFPYLYTREQENRRISDAIHNKDEYLPIPIRPRSSILRYRSQQAVLTTSITEQADVPENPVLGPRDGSHKHISGSLLQKINFPRKWKLEILRLLTGMGITHSTMFPTLDGLGAETTSIRNFGTQT